MYSKQINMYIIYSNLDFIAILNIGTEEMVHEFFLNVLYILENKKWGSVYPTIMNKFYKGKIEPKDVNQAILEMKDIKNKLQQKKVKEMVDASGEISKLALHELYSKYNMDEVFTNDQGQKITDVILSTLKIIKNKKVSLYIGDYHLKEFSENNLKKIVTESQKQQKRTKLIKYTIYIIYALIVVSVKLIAPNEQFTDFFKIFLFTLIFSIILDVVIKSKTKSYLLQIEKKHNEYNNLPPINIEKITLKKDIFSSTFDSILDEINCEKTFEGIKETLELKKIKNWKLDLEKISNELNRDEGYCKRIVENIKLSYKKIESYELKTNIKILSDEYIRELYAINNIYRLINIDDDIYLITFFKEK